MYNNISQTTHDLLCLFQRFPFFHLFPSTPCRMHYLNRKVCVRNDSPIERRANTRQPASQPASHRASSICIRNRTNVLRRLRVFESAFPDGEKGSGISPAISCSSDSSKIGKFIPFTNSFPANVIFIGSHLIPDQPTARFPSFAERMRRGIPHNSNK